MIFFDFCHQTGLEACAERVKALEAELDKVHVETNVLANKMDSALQTKSQVQEKLNDRENVIQSLTETIDQLVSAPIASARKVA